MLFLYFDPDTTAESRAAIREEFVRALSGYPNWAVQRAFDAWVRRGTRRPSPGEIAILAQQEVAPMQQEVTRRTEVAEPPRNPDRVTPEAAAEIMRRAGFTVGGFRGAPTKPAPHWSDAVPVDCTDPEVIRATREAAGQ